MSVCLVMLMCNEGHIVERCIASVRSIIDHVCIADTGSTDDSVERLSNADVGVPYRVLQHEWKNFAWNRTRAIRAANRLGHDWLLLMDPDEEAEIVGEPSFPDDCDVLDGQQGEKFTFWRPRIIRSGLHWEYRGVVHEALYLRERSAYDDMRRLQCPDWYHGDLQPRHKRASWLRIHNRMDGPRNGVSEREKYLKDAHTLETAPKTARNVFYTAQSCRDAGELQKALELYIERMGMPGWDEETWYAAFQAACLVERTSTTQDAIVAYLTAWSMRPTRNEPLVELARMCRHGGNVPLARLFAEKALAIPRPDDQLFLDEGCYHSRLREILA